MNDQLQNQTCAAFTAALASAAPTPGGGGAAALAGALAASLGAMAANVTAHNPKFSATASELYALAAEAERQRTALLALIDADAQGFSPLAAAYAIPKADPTRASTLSAASEQACAAPLEMMRHCCEIAELLENALVKTSKLLISDVGCGAALCRAALVSASMNVWVNTGAIGSAARARIEAEAARMLTQFVPLCDQISDAAMKRLRGG